MRTRSLTVLILASLAAPTTVLAESFVYVSVAGENRIAIYDRQPATGDLKYRGSTMVGGGPGGLTIDPNGKFLFASIRSIGNLASFRMDPSTGALRPLSEVPAGADPAYVAVDSSGKFLLSAYYRAAKVMVHRILEDGSIADEPVQELATADKAHAIVTDRSNRFAFVPHTGPNVIFQFRFDPRTGLLSAAEVAQVRLPTNTGPRHLLFHPTRDFAYVSDEQGSSATVYRFLADKGLLEPIQTVSTLPAGFARRNSTAHLEVHPSGKFVYVANRGHDSLARFRIDQESGRITALGQTKTEATPRSFNISATGQHLYAAGQSTGKLALFTVDAADGSLSRRATYEVGAQPWWVLVVEH